MEQIGLNDLSKIQEIFKELKISSSINSLKTLSKNSFKKYYETLGFIQALFKMKNLRNNMLTELFISDENSEEISKKNFLIKTNSIDFSFLMLTLDMILDIHQQILSLIPLQEKDAGQFRKFPAHPSDQPEYFYLAPEKIETALQDLIDSFNYYLHDLALKYSELLKNEKNTYLKRDQILYLKILPWEIQLEIIKLVAWFQYHFLKIHPFSDGNGRTVRILIDGILMYVFRKEKEKIPSKQIWHLPLINFSIREEEIDKKVIAEFREKYFEILQEEENIALRKLSEIIIASIYLNLE